MKRLAAKLGFVHRTLWHRDRAYRWAALLGPPPLIGCAAAALLWVAVAPFATSRPSPATGVGAPWARWQRPAAREGQPWAEAPSAALPPSDARGGFVGYQTGWAAAIQPFTVDATLDVDVIASVEGRFTLDRPTIPLERIVDAAPPSGLYVGTGRAFFTVRTAGVYAFSARLTRAGAQSANCLVRLASGHHQMLRNVVLNSAGTAVLNFPPTEFQLEPGLLRLQFAVGCWRGDQIVRGGELALLVRHPGESSLIPATASEVIRPVEQNGGGGR